MRIILVCFLLFGAFGCANGKVNANAKTGNPTDRHIASEIARHTCTHLPSSATWCVDSSSVGDQIVYSVSVQTSTRTISVSSDQTYKNLDAQNVLKGLMYYVNEVGLQHEDTAHIMGPVTNAVNDTTRTDDQVALYIATWMARVGAQ